jgi:hypothetical protein
MVQVCNDWVVYILEGLTQEAGMVGDVTEQVNAVINGSSSYPHVDVFLYLLGLPVCYTSL